MVQLVARLLLALLVVGLAGCERGPDAAVVRAAVQQQLDDALGARVLEVASLDRAGSAPLQDRAGRLIYFNARLKLERDYDFTRWDAHNAASLASLLGAGPKGVFGLHPEGNKAGDVLGVYGSAAFTLSDGRYALVPFVPAVQTDASLPVAVAAATIQPTPREAPPPTPVKVALARLHELSAQGSPPRLPESERDSILIEEFGQAYDRARARLDCAAAVSVIAGGPAGGTYAEPLGVLDARAHNTKLPFDTLSSEGKTAQQALETAALPSAPAEAAAEPLAKPIQPPLVIQKPTLPRAEASHPVQVSKRRMAERPAARTAFWRRAKGDRKGLLFHPTALVNTSRELILSIFPRED